MRIRIRLITVMRIHMPIRGIWFLIDADPDQDPPFHPDADPDPDPDPSFQIKVQTVEIVLKEAHITYVLVYHL